MWNVSSSRLISLWEESRTVSPIERSLLLLAETRQDELSKLAELPIGQRDRALLALRETIFGDVLQIYAKCSKCNEDLEFPFSCAALTAISNDEPPAQFEVRWEDFLIRCRPLNSIDMLNASIAGSVELARAALAESSFLGGERSGVPISWNEIPEEDYARLSAALADADPGAELLFELTCPKCVHEWPELLEIGQLLWLEIEGQVQRLLWEVNFLARTYHWSEQAILSMSSLRRKTYLNMAGS